MFICQQLSAASFPSIGALFGRNHSTVIAACQIIAQRMARETAFRLFMARLAREISGACRLRRRQREAQATRYQTRRV